MYSYLIVLLSIGVVLTSATITEEVELPIEAVNCIENFKITHIKWLPVFQQCKLSVPPRVDEEGEEFKSVADLHLLTMSNFRVCLGDEAISEYDEAADRCKDLGKNLSMEQQRLGQKFFIESMKDL